MTSTPDRSRAQASFQPRARAYDVYLVAVNGLLRVPVHRFREWVFRTMAGNALGSNAVLEWAIRLTTRGGVTVGAHRS